MKIRSAHFILIIIPVILICYYFLSQFNQDDPLKRVIIGVEAPYMKNGRGLVLLIDSDQQPQMKSKLPKFQEFLFENALVENLANLKSESPHIYIEIEFNSAKKLEVASSEYLDGQEPSIRLNSLIAGSLKIFGVSNSEMKRAQELAEKSRILSSPITSEPETGKGSQGATN